MNELLTSIQKLKHSDIQTKIQQRIQEFKNVNTHSVEELFQELCFCILTANFNAERTILIHQRLRECFCTTPEEALSKKLRQQGYRFPNIRAVYIIDSVSKKDVLPTIIQTFQRDERRTWLVQNIKGLGYKEASHFLRNIGFDDYAIIDSHILELLERYNFIKQPKTLTKKKYIEIEKLLQTISQQTHLTLAELDLYLWYMETGKILK
jgi:N-glycosylase/DNA lyase